MWFKVARREPKNAPLSLVSSSAGSLEAASYKRWFIQRLYSAMSAHKDGVI